VEDLVEYMDPEKIALLQNAMSPVKGFEEEEKVFFREMQELGVRLERI